MADGDELAYLQPGFDLNSLTVPRLRNILVQHDIAFASSSKKAQLIETIEADLLPKAKKLLRERDRVRRTSKGITNVATQEDPADGDGDGQVENDRGIRQQPQAPKTPRSRKSKSTLAEETPATSARSRTPGARKSTSKPRQSDLEPESQVVASTRKTRKSLPKSQPAAAAVQVEDAAQINRADASSPFSDDNPFQSGSSPPSDSRRVSSGSRLRKSTGRLSSSRGKEAKSLQVKQEDEDGTDVNAYIPAAPLQTDEHGVDTTEEFAPSAKNELETEAPARSAVLVRRKKKPASTVSKIWPASLLVIASTAVGTWYRQEKVNVGFCGVGQPHWSLAENENIPSWVHEQLQPACEPCPSHAICYPNLEVRCENDFILKPHPLSLFGIVPLPPTCEPDSEKEKRIKAVADRAVEELRERRAAYECGEELDSSQTSVATAAATAEAREVTPEIPEEQLREQVNKLRRKDMGEDEFEHLWQSALGDIKSREEVAVTTDGQGRSLLSSTSLAKVGVACSIRRGFWRLLATYRFTLILLAIVGGGGLWARHEILSRLQSREQAKELAEKVFDRLATQAAIKEAGRTSESFLSVRGLRDDILRHVINARERQRVWEHVKKIVEGNSNVRPGDRESERTGEVSRVWEWTGPIDLASAFSTRLSGGTVVHESPLQGRGPDDVVAVRKWDEGRPIY